MSKQNEFVISVLSMIVQSQKSTWMEVDVQLEIWVLNLGFALTHRMFHWLLFNVMDAILELLYPTSNCSC